MKHYFTNANGYLRGIRIDSVKTYADSTIYYPFHTPRHYTCSSVDSAGASWLGKQVSQLNDGTFLFGNSWNDTVILKTQANTGDSWIFYNDTTALYYQATVAGTDTMTISGILDSIKRIIITAQNTSGIVTTDPVDSFQIILSKNNGFVQAFDLYNFPYHAPDAYFSPGLDFYLDRTIGFPSYPIPYAYSSTVPDRHNSLFRLISFAAPTLEDVFHTHIGDVYEYTKCNGFIEHPTLLCDVPDEYDMDTITAVNINPANTQSDYSGWAAQNEAIFYSASPTYAISAITGAMVYDTSKIISTTLMPEESGQRYLYYFIQNDTSYGIVSTLYCTDQFSFCAFESTDITAVYKAPLGLVHRYFADMGASQFDISDQKLVYFNKTDSTYGTPIIPPTSVPNIMYGDQLITLFPNPVTDQLTVTANIKINNAIISDVLGHVLYTLTGDANKIGINVSILPAGMYFIKINGTEVKKFTKE